MPISWDEYFMGVALLSAMRSKDPHTQVGACIVNADKIIVGIGYNGAPRGWEDEKFPWKKGGPYLEEKYPFVIHAELNAILNSSNRDLRGCTMYNTFFPCNECAKAIVQSGIKKIVYLSDKYHDMDLWKASRILLDTAGVECVRMKTDRKEIKLEFDENR